MSLVGERMKKVLFVASIKDHIVGFHLPFINYFLEQGYEVHVATRLDGKIDNDSKIIWKNINFCRSPFSKDNIKSFKELLKYMKENQFQLVHTHTPVASVLCRVCAKLTKTTPVIYTAHGFHFYKGAPIKNWILYYTIEKIMSRFTDLIITMNEEDYKVATSKFKNTKVVNVKGVGLDIDKYCIGDTKNIELKKSFGFKEDDFIISYVAILREGKNHKQILEAMILLVKKYPNIKLLIVGNGNLEEWMRKYISDHNLDNNVIMAGLRDDIAEILNITDLYVSTSYREGLPRNIMEAMAAKLAVVTTDIRGSSDLVKDGVNGLTVKIDDVRETAKAIEKLYLDENLRKIMGENGRILIQEYDIKKVLTDMINIYEDVMCTNE